MNLKNFPKNISEFFHFVSLILLIWIGLIFVFLAFKWIFLWVFNFYNWKISEFDLLWEIFLVFLYVEIIASIKIYFSDNFHFPLRFFFYIWITDLIRFLIINHDNREVVIYSSIWILLIVISMILYELRWKFFWKNKKDDLQI